eukprot:m.111455 g.111455  ORF g.111455 m.111455 type:complete len:163 (+) comp37427_c0_seq1:299-787(+)
MQLWESPVVRGKIGQPDLQHLSAHQLRVTNDATVVCSVKDPEVAESFHRFGVEQAEALFLATNIVNNNGMLDNVTGVGTVKLGNSVYDTCGDLISDSFCAEKQAMALSRPTNPEERVLASIIGPYYIETFIMYNLTKYRRCTRKQSMTVICRTTLISGSFLL